MNLPLAQMRPRDHLFYVSRNRTVLATARDGFIHGAGEEGLYIYQTRMLSRYRYRINGKSPHPVGVTNIEEHNQIGYYVTVSPNPDEDLFRGALGPGGRAATESIELRVARFVSDGLQEEVHLCNHTLRTAKITLELELDADFADSAEIHGERLQNGRLERSWRIGDGGAAELVWDYSVEHQFEHQGYTGRAALHRSATLQFGRVSPLPTYNEGERRVRWEIELPPHATWRTSVLLSATIDGIELQPQKCDGTFAPQTYYDRVRDEFLHQATQFSTGTPSLAFTVERALEQARRDLVALRLLDLDRDDGGWTVAAGLPVYIAVFGRDTLTTSWQASILSDGMMRGSLAELADTQALGDDDWRDAQAGRFIHQMDTGPLAKLQYNPHASYYGSLTGPGFYPVAVSSLWHWTGDQDLVRRFLPPAMKGLEWLERHARRDDGFYAYQTRSEQGVKNQAWKDSYDAIVYPDGSQVKDPIAPAEFQAFVFASKVRVSELLWWLDEKEASRRLFDEAMTLRDRFNEVFWMDDEGCFGMGLDGAGRLIRSVGSESGHALAAGIVSNDRVERTAKRLFQPDLFSGWGIRTLSSRHPAFNPFSYHRGSVWPAEQAAFSMGLMRYGFHDRLYQLTKAQFEVASLFEHCRLPELFSGHQRDLDHPVPALYPNADSPQAWSAAAIPCMIQAILCLFPYAPLRALFINPQLPEWLPELHLKNLRVGNACVHLDFQRTATGTSYHVHHVHGTLHVVHQPSPWSFTATPAERVIDALSSLVPH